MNETYHQVNQVAMVKFVFNVLSMKAYKATCKTKAKNWARANFVTQSPKKGRTFFANSLHHADGNSDGFGLVLSVIWPPFVGGPWLVEIWVPLKRATFVVGRKQTAQFVSQQTQKTVEKRPNNEKPTLIPQLSFLLKRQIVQVVFRPSSYNKLTWVDNLSQRQLLTRNSRCVCGLRGGDGAARGNGVFRPKQFIAHYQTIIYADQKLAADWKFNTTGMTHQLSAVLGTVLAVVYLKPFPNTNPAGYGRKNSTIPEPASFQNDTAFRAPFPSWICLLI